MSVVISKKRSSGHLTNDENSVPPSNTDNDTLPPMPKRLHSELSALSFDLQSRLSSLESQTASECSSLQLAFNRSLSKLPPVVRRLTLQQFAVSYGLNVTAVNMAAALSSQQQLDSWIQQTPRVAGRINRELLQLTSSTLPGMADVSLLLSAQRMTRATARKAGINHTIANANALLPSARPLLISQTLPALPANAAVFETPHAVRFGRNGR